LQVSINDTLIILVKGDITDMVAEAIVNAANTKLILGSGVAGAILARGGNSIQDECNEIGHCDVGSAVITGAGNLPAKNIIHAVGPIMGSGDEDRKLTNTTMSVLEIAELNHIRSLAFPAISTGVFGYPNNRCAKVMLSSTIAFLRSGSDIDRIFFCLFDDDTYSVFESELNRLTSD